MSENELLEKLRQISDKTIKIRYLLDNSIYKNDSERETFLLVEVAIALLKEIEEDFEKILFNMEYN